MLRAVVTLAFVFVATLAAAQDRRPSHCIAVADKAPGIEYVQLASYTEPVEPFSVRISYIDHSMFLIQTEGGLSAVTDYNGFIGVTDFLPDIVTMNNAHGSHWTSLPNAEIPHVLEGWAKGDEPEDHYLDLGEMLVRNVHTDTRGGFDGYARKNGNSIFVFEVAGLCIGHLGHLHHIPDDAQFAALGRVDVVMAAVDGGLTLPTEDIVQVVKRLRSSIVLPMHWFGRSTLDSFLNGMADEFRINRENGSSLEVSLRTLPDAPTVVVLQPEFLQLPE